MKDTIQKKTETGHTPGPWTNRGMVIAKQQNAGGRKFTVCDMSLDLGLEAADANARLIAAAPELLVDNAALRGIILRHVKAKELSEHEKAAFNKAAHNYAAIARAEGRDA